MIDAKRGALRGLSRGISIVLLVFACLHGALLFVYLSDYQKNFQEKEYQALDDANTALLELILFARDSGMDEQRWQENIKELQKARIRVGGGKILLNLTKTPLWHWRYDDSIAIGDLFTTDKHNFAFSYQLAAHEWLNIALVPTLNILQAMLLLLILDGFALGIILFYWWSVVRFTVPLEDFRDSAKKLGIDMNAQLTAVQGPPIVQETANAIQQLQQRIQVLLNTRNQTLAAISHDLRTPITRLKLRAQFIKDEATQQKFLHDLNDMEVMINNILAYAREDLLLREEYKKFDFVAMVSALCDDYNDLGYQLSFESEQHRLAYQGKSVALKRALDNIINNALQRADSVKVVFKVHEAMVELLLTDDGPGIPEEQLAQVTQAFYRLHDQKHKGYGLGLAIANDIIVSHQGEIHLNNIEPHGLQVTILLPVHVAEHTHE